MAVPTTNLTYIGLDKPTIPYRSNTSPTDDNPHFIQGSINFLPTVSGWNQKRPGFSSALETALSVIPGVVKRLFFWERWTGSTTNSDCFFCMASVIVGATSTVYKLNLGNGVDIPADASFSLLYTDATSTTPFDYQDTNNFVFFGNETSRINMRKYNGVDCSLWGIDAPISAPDISLVSGSLPDGLSFNDTTGVLSGTPTVTTSTSITVTVTDSAANTATQTLNLSIYAAGLGWTTPSGMLPPATATVAYSTTVVAQSGTTPYTFAINSGTLPAGLSLNTATGAITGTPSTPAPAVSFSIKVTDHVGAISIRSFTLFVGSSALSITPTSLPSATVGTAYSQALTAAGGTSPYSYVIVGGGLPTGLTLTAGTIAGTPTVPVNTNLIVRVTDSAGTPLSAEFSLSFSVTSITLAILNTSLPNAQVGVPYSQTIGTSGGISPFSFTYTAGTLTAQTGYVWGYTYTSIYGHESSMSDLSVNSGLFTDQDVEVDVIASTDPQVNGINIYRSTDGGDEDPSEMQLVTSLSNGTIGYIDSTPDIFLGTQSGPALYVNNPPQPIRGLRWSNGRIWGFTGATTWFTGNEEVTNGIRAECMSNAKNGNYYQWPSQVGTIEVTDNGVDIGLYEEFWQISGDTLSTFRKSRLLKGGGCVSTTCSCVVGTTVYWIDTAKQFFSSASGEIGQSIRLDLANLDFLSTFLVYYKFSTMNWLVILDGANGRLLLYDMDLDQWLPPWSTAATCIGAGQTAPTAISLIAAYTTGHVLTLTPGSYLDDGVTYADEVRTSLFSIVPGARTNARNSSNVRQPVQWEMELNSSIQVDDQGNQTGYGPNIPDLVYTLLDDNPSTRPLSGWFAITDPPIPLEFDAQWQEHLEMNARRWMCNDAGMARRVALCAQWNAAEVGWIMYSMDLGWRAT